MAHFHRFQNLKGSPCTKTDVFCMMTFSASFIKVANWFPHLNCQAMNCRLPSKLPKLYDVWEHCYLCIYVICTYIYIYICIFHNFFHDILINKIRLVSPPNDNNQVRVEGGRWPYIYMNICIRKTYSIHIHILSIIYQCCDVHLAIYLLLWKCCITHFTGMLIGKWVSGCVCWKNCSHNFQTITPFIRWYVFYLFS